jgi:hypothetical protein
MGRNDRVEGSSKLFEQGKEKGGEGGIYLWESGHEETGLSNVRALGIYTFTVVGLSV